MQATGEIPRRAERSYTTKDGKVRKQKPKMGPRGGTHRKAVATVAKKAQEEAAATTAQKRPLTSHCWTASACSCRIG